ncbi:M15 family metallopeptidase [Arthrobacter sp. A5]|uniref:M15 family metallopeptidase n=1 Tax=Arthrobacter sp. A5 TaxID=576926 RepID=UPI003DAA07B2
MATLPGRRTVAKFLVGGTALAIFAACTAPARPVPSSSSASKPGTTAAAAPGADGPPAGASVSGESTAPSPQPAGGAPSPAASPAHALTATFSLTDPSSPWVLVNKHHPLNPVGYEPPDLVQPQVVLGSGGETALLRVEAADAAGRMFAAAAAAGAAMTLLSSYRSYDTQLALYNNYVAGFGSDDADTKSARAGYSEHQTGLALDIGDAGGACAFDPCFAEQPAAAWAAGNCHRFGFIVRYQLGKDGMTGFFAEPWHLRYVGVELATDLVAKGYGSYEEYLGLEPAPAYL